MDFDPYVEWEEYQAVEEEFLRYLRYVPLTQAHYKVWSFSLGNILINVGSLIDSFIKNLLDRIPLDSLPRASVARKEIGQRRITSPKMGDYEKGLESHFTISKKRVFEIRNYSSMIPFSNWSRLYNRWNAPILDENGDVRWFENRRNPKIPLRWWTAYTDLKHDRFQNKEKATLINTLEALGALFLLNVISPVTIPVLIDYRIINPGPYTVDSVRKILSQTEPLNTAPLHAIYAKTNLFGYVYESEYYSWNHEHKKMILSPSYPGYG